ncbi:3-oxoacyl-[acyl-carrier-protein] reductase FabG [Roseovarius sp. THAF27]|uniref:3-oxoacyl-ACP reductase FabG n=1 Tax=Roseovarius TaxID=74030 RepID=UPI0012682C19|nr:MULTISPECIES: 3-oxoacyl-ACP reductase FabG [Roseovarius]MBY5987723.1 3-oxoacyl-ACP reductase FabG [Roseovarius atlanticus]MBY6123114.1 3-oxoacyl-ACP reductase FabG [Roseovarius atlanticus]MBY6147610.1 3-oxoacyl-ACP reductase FabG [Roseovarius atlanticus]QFT79991.1 3-oxoacyl-[acyl-carrier-protein] reductase FabG [Roseovarius sp. THAF27]QFT96910.1 3-oxoacyl-[acyl-carrier-protein] reductase FabG [Roseovarius sp. THAF8]
MLTSLKGKSVIVTGGSKGIGRGIATVFARQGAKLTIAARNEDDLKKAASEIEGDVRYEVCDVADWDSVKAMVDSTAEAQGGLHVLCANAGAFPQTKMIDMDPAEWDQVMATNLRSSFLCVKAAIPHFEKAGKGRVVITSSITGPHTGFPGWAHYGASKSGQLGFIKTAAMELSRYNTTINAVMPGNIYTEGLQDLGQDYLDTMAASIPLKRLGDVEDIGNAALFFASDEAGYITGQQIVIDGGQILPESLEAMEEI